MINFDRTARQIFELSEIAEARRAVAHVDDEELLRAIERRRSDVEYETSKAAAAADAAQMALSRRLAMVTAAMDARPSARAGVVATLLIAGLLAVGLSLLLFRREWGLQLWGAWRSPLASGWWIGGFWTLLAIGVAVFLASAINQGLFSHRARARQEAQLDLESYRRAEAKADADLEEALQRSIRQIIVQTLNARAAATWRSTVVLSDDPAVADRTIPLGLSEVVDEANQTPTAARDEILRLLKDMPGGSIGVSGPRGVGKSTLLSSICSANLTIEDSQVIAINTSAPVEYDGRDFLLHLFSSLCRQTLKRETGTALGHADNLFLSSIGAHGRSVFSAQAGPIARLLLVAGFTMALVTLTLAGVVASNATPQKPAVLIVTQAGPGQKTKSSAAPARTTADRPERVTTAQVVAALQIAPIGSVAVLSVLCLVFGSVIVIEGLIQSPTYASLPRILGGRSRPQLFSARPVVARTMDELRNIRFQRSYTAGWSGGLKVPVGLELAATTGLSYAQTPESLPELVEGFRDYVAYLVSQYGRVIIGIDELDKLKSAREAESFLNSVKSVFNINGCFFLISVSEHALASFERRGLGFRDAFDSALDSVLQIHHCDLAGSWAILSRRILNLPAPFLHLCHMLSGGLPRDLIRYARDALAMAAKIESGGAGIVQVAGALVQSEALAKIRATSIALRSVDSDHDANELLVRVARLSEFGSTVELAAGVAAFRKDLDGRSGLAGKVDRDVLICLDLCLYLDLLAKMDRVAALMAAPRTWKIVEHEKISEAVAHARQALEVSMPLAAVRLDTLEHLIAAAEKSPARPTTPKASRKPPAHKKAAAARTKGILPGPAVTGADRGRGGRS